MEKKLSDVTADMETLRQLPPQRTAQPLRVGNFGGVRSTRPAESVVSLGDAGEKDAISTDMSWAERLEFEEEYASEELPQSSKVLLTEVTQPMETFLCKVFAVKDNTVRRQLRQQFIVPSTLFTTAPRLDKTIADECSKNTKSSDNTLSTIQALLLDVVGPLTAILESINQNKELSIEDVEGAVKLH